MFADLETDISQAPVCSDKDDGRETFPCGSCQGTGKRVIGYANCREVRCKFCQGRGYFLSSYKDRMRKREQSRDRKQSKKNESISRWKQINTELYEYLKSVAGWNNFAASLMNNLSRYGSLTEKQEGAAYRMMEKSKVKAAEMSSKPDPEYPVYDNIRGLFDDVLKARKKPILRVMGVRISVAPLSGRNGGCLYVKYEDEYQGKIAPEGRFMAVRSAHENINQVLATIDRDPKEAAISHGRETGTCSCCGAELTNPKSIELGIGPICASKWGW